MVVVRKHNEPTALVARTELQYSSPGAFSSDTCDRFQNRGQKNYARDRALGGSPLDDVDLVPRRELEGHLDALESLRRTVEDLERRIRELETDG